MSTSTRPESGAPSSPPVSMELKTQCLDWRWRILVTLIWIPMKVGAFHALGYIWVMFMSIMYDMATCTCVIQNVRDLILRKQESFLECFMCMIILCMLTDWSDGVDPLSKTAQF